MRSSLLKDGRGPTSSSTPTISFTFSHIPDDATSAVDRKLNVRCDTEPLNEPREFLMQRWKKKVL
jgi:hypothetical protein